MAQFEDNQFRTSNEANGLHIYYYLGKQSKAEVRVLIYDKEGKLLDEKMGETEKGIHEIVWNAYDAEPGGTRLPSKWERRK